METALAAQLFIRLTPKLAGYIFVIRVSDAVLPIPDILGGRGVILGRKGDPPPQNQGPLVGETSLLYQKSGGPRH